MALAVSKYGFINAKLRTRLSTLLTEEFFDALAGTHSLVDAMQMLKPTVFAPIDEVYAKTGDLKLAELALFGDEVRIFTDVERRTTGEVREFCSAIAMRYETETLKHVLRLWFDRVFRGRNIEESLGYLYRETIHHDLHIDEILQASDIARVSEILSDTPYKKILEDATPEILARSSLFAFEIALDRHYYGNLFDKINSLEPDDRKIAERLVGVEIDLQNINWIIRFKALYNLPLSEALSYTLPWGFSVNRDTMARAYSHDRVTEIFGALLKRHEGFTAMLSEQGGDIQSRLVLVERILAHVMMHEVSRALVGNPFTIGIIASYFILKKQENKRVLTVLNAKQYNIKPEEIKSRL